MTSTKPNMRVWHPLFQWGTVLLPSNTENGLSNVEFDFEEITYRTVMKGYRIYKKSEDQGNRVTVPNYELFEKELSSAELSVNWRLRLIGYNATIKL